MLNSESSFMQKARRAVVYYYNQEIYRPGGEQLTYDETYVVWFSKTLQNWKALLSTTRPDDMYYELTYNGDKGETYLDAYRKRQNVVIKD